LAPPHCAIVPPTQIMPFDTFAPEGTAHMLLMQQAPSRQEPPVAQHG
jgi:hypothetical protein